jgi:hypothetical protein
MTWKIGDEGTGVCGLKSKEKRRWKGKKKNMEEKM